MDVELANDIAKYVQECECTIRNLRNEITLLQENIAQQLRKEQQTRVEQRKIKRNDTYTRQTVCEAFGCSKFDDSTRIYEGVPTEKP